MRIVFCGEVDLLSVIHDDYDMEKTKFYMFKRAIKQSPTAIVVTDIEGNILCASEQFTHLTGYTLEDVEGKPLELFRSEFYGDEHYKQACEKLSTEEIWRSEMLNCRKDGTMYWSAVTVAPFRDESGETVYFIINLEDITAHKKNEEKLTRNNVELSAALEQVKITQSQLIQQESLASIGLLAAGIAHEINNPLGYVTSNMYVLEDYVERFKEILASYEQLAEYVSKSPDSEICARLQSLKELKTAKKLQYVIDDLPSLFADSNEGLSQVARIVRGLSLFSRADQMTVRGEYDLNAGIENTLVVANNEIKHCAVLNKNLKPLPMIEAIGGQINQVLLNILLNAAYAVKAVGPEMGTISIATWHDNDRVFCEIKDNGIGMNEETLKQIFQPFFTTKPLGQGTGLGLSISYDIIVHKHKGCVMAESKPGKGTKFTLSIPIMHKQEEGGDI